MWDMLYAQDRIAICLVHCIVAHSVHNVNSKHMKTTFNSMWESFLLVLHTKMFIRTQPLNSLSDFKPRCKLNEIEIYQVQDFLSIPVSALSDKSVQHQALIGRLILF